MYFIPSHPCITWVNQSRDKMHNFVYGNLQVSPSILWSITGMVSLQDLRRFSLLATQPFSQLPSWPFVM